MRNSVLDKLIIYETQFMGVTRKLPEIYQKGQVSQSVSESVSESVSQSVSQSVSFGNFQKLSETCGKFWKVLKG